MKVKRSIREWFTADLRAGVLTPRRGCQRVVVEVGEDLVEKSTREPHRILIASIGDRLMLVGASIDQIQCAEVTAIRGGGTQLVLSLGYGAVNDGTVHVLKRCKAAVATARKAA